MAAITRIEVANFLCDGYEPGKEWIPLYRGETLRLAGVNGFGCSTAIQIENAGGKTSLTEACLFLLTRNSRMKTRVAARVAPSETSWTHIRIEFAERPIEDDPAQRNLIVIDQQDVAGVPYVIGMVSTRGKEPLFYRYQGVLEDAPCFLKDNANLALIDNETFKASVKRMPGAKWDTWRSAREWEQEIMFFCDTEVLKQNVQFQIDGAGDYSAVFNKVNNRNGDGYDVNFFRQIVAPELLRDPLGNEAGEGEERFENALLNHLRMSVDRLLDISARQRELDSASTALIKFEPIEQKAQAVIEADQNYKEELSNLAGDAAVVVTLARRKIPGLPNIEATESYASNKKLMKALSCLVISQREGVLITDSGLAELCGVETNRLNEYARERGINKWSAIAYPLELIGDFKFEVASQTDSMHAPEAPQPIVYKDDIKLKSHGGRRKNVNYYDLAEAIEAASAVSNLSGAHTDGLDDILTRAFGIAIDEIDTNPYRREQHRLTKEIEVASGALAATEADENHWSGKYDALLRERTDAQENQTAYETFRVRAAAGDFPSDHVDNPLAARTWAEEQLTLARSALEGHHKKVAELTARYNIWRSLNEQHMGAPLQGILDDLVARFEAATSARETANATLNAERARRSALEATFKVRGKELSTLAQQRDHLEVLANKIPAFIALFGDVDPETLDPTKDLQEANRALQEMATEWQKALTDKRRFDDLRPDVSFFLEIFGNANPTTLNPIKDLLDNKEEIRIEGEILSAQQPLVEALEMFREANPSKLPNDWLEDTDNERQTLSTESHENELRTAEIKRELDELETVAMADDRVYSEALAALETGKIRFERLHALIGTKAGARQGNLLTLFSSALSAPVVETLEDADKATKILEQAKLIVPVFLKAPLIDFVEQGEYKLSGKLVHSYLIGRRTRQVEILLNPSLIAEERERLTIENNGLATRMAMVKSRLRELLPTSHLVEMAVRAKKAIEYKAEETYAEASKRHTELSAQLRALEQRAKQEAVASIDAMKEYAARGGDDSYNTLVAITIPQLESAKSEQEKRIARLHLLNAEDAIRSLHAAKDYKREGGDKVRSEIRNALAVLESSVAEIATQISTLDEQINTVLSRDFEAAANALSQLNKTYEIEKRDLKAAIEFQDADELGYMQRTEVHGKELNEAISKYGDCMKGIDFERAARFVRPGNEDVRSMAVRIAEAEGKRNEAKTKKVSLTNERTQHQGRLAAIEPFIGDLHGLAAAIRTQYAKIASFSDDIRYRMSNITLDPEILEYADAIRDACLGEQASTTGVARAAISNLTQSINHLEIDTRPLAMRAAEKASAFDSFQSKRTEFCEKARSGEINGLQLPEIERIADARTIEQLALIHQIKDKIDASIKEHRGQLEVFHQAMEESKAATIDNMTRFARQAETNLAIMERVMQKSPNARFFVHADVADAGKVRDIIDSLIATIQERESAVRDRGTAALNEYIEQRNREYLEQIHTQIYHKVFSNPSIHFSHKAIRGGEKTRLTGEEGGLSGGQRTALMMMWLIKQADYALTRSVVNSDLSRRDQKAALRAAQRIMFFDGLFSNLSSDEIISNAFQGLSDVDQNFQLIGLIHNPSYINNKDIFPVLVVGKRYSATKDGKRHCFISVDPYENKLGFFQSAYRKNPQKDQPNA